MLDTEISKIKHDSILQYYGAWIVDGNAHLAYEFAGKVINLYGFHFTSNKNLFITLLSFRDD